MALINESVIAFGVLTLSAYIFGTIFYRLYLHPLARFPGPHLAATTQLYEMYWNIVKPGQFTHHLHSLHDTYGPIIRYNPWELHIRDAHFLETVYSHARRDKKLEHVNFLDAPLSMVATVEHSLHRLRRAALNTYFTKPQVGAYTPRIQEKVNNLIARLDGDYKGTNKVLNLSDAFKCFAGDVVGDFCFASDHDFISAPDFKVPFLEAFDQLLLFMQYSKYFPFLLKIFHSLPDIFIPSTVMTVLQFQREITNRIQDITNGTPQDRPEEYIPVFRGLSSSNLPPEEKTLQRLAQEGITLAGAGQTTVPGVLKTAMFHLFQETSKMERLSKEIMTVFPDPAHPPSLSQLEQLPYLTGVIMEALRLSPGSVQLTPRIAYTPLVYGVYVIPAGTAVSMNFYSAHHDEQVFPDSHSFVPERWLENPTVPVLDTNGAPVMELITEKESDRRPSVRMKRLSRYMVAFGKGSRQCIGIEFAWAQLYLLLANIIRRCDLEMFETEWRDVGFVREFGGPFPAPDARGLRVIVKNVV